MHEVEVKLTHDLRLLEHAQGNERPGLQVASPFELEDVALGADDVLASGKLFQEPVSGLDALHSFFSDFFFKAR